MNQSFLSMVRDTLPDLSDYALASLKMHIEIEQEYRNRKREAPKEAP